MTEFEWDDNKAESNRIKDGVAFSDALTVFGDRSALTFFDKAHSEHEDRFLTIGESASGKLLSVCHTDRPGATRLISAGPASRRERQVYVDAGE